MLGVTGTLKVLSECKKKICETDYKITQTFFIPSVYGESRLENKGIKIV